MYRKNKLEDLYDFALIKYSRPCQRYRLRRLLKQGALHATKGKGAKAYVGGHLQGQSKPMQFLNEGLRQCRLFYCATCAHA